MLEFSVCTFTAFLCLACDGSVLTEDISCLSPVWDSGMLVKLPYGLREILEKMGAMVVVQDSGFDMYLGYMAYSVSRTSIGHCVSRHGSPLI